jgi:hypothetical protein
MLKPEALADAPATLKDLIPADGILVGEWGLEESGPLEDFLVAEEGCPPVAAEEDLAVLDKVAVVEAAPAVPASNAFLPSKDFMVVDKVEFTVAAKAGLTVAEPVPVLRCPISLRVEDPTRMQIKCLRLL